METPAGAHVIGGSTLTFPPEEPAASWRADPDVALMERARDGDLAAFETLFRKHSPGVVKLAYQFVRNRERAEELAQTGFLQLYRARARYEPRARFVTYLYRIVTNVCLNEVRRRQYSVTIESLDSPSEDSGAGSHGLDDFTADPLQHVTTIEVANRVRSILESLPYNQRTAFLLGRVEGLSYGDVAEILGTSVSAVKSLIFRATAALRTGLEDYTQ
jgi:RNA polymerase sigma-70 factor (ECF subfamily)